jgi:mxaJ protein
MSSGCPRATKWFCLMSAAMVCAAVVPGFAQQRPLRFCADPNNPPYSMRTEAGFDNRIAMLLAGDLGRKPVFVWSRARRGFLRERFNKNECDVLMGVPMGVKGVLSTKPYYRSTYVFVTRRRDHLQVASFHDSALNGQRIGLQIMEEDLSPPSLPLIRYGHAAQLVGFQSFGREAGNIMRAVADRQLGLAVVWGPTAGYFARQQGVPLVLTPVSPQREAGIPFVFDIVCAVHKRDTQLRDALDAAIQREAPSIHRILVSYGVPLVASGKGTA